MWPVGAVLEAQALRWIKAPFLDPQIVELFLEITLLNTHPLHSVPRD